jgi:hypothetical protein
LARSLGGDCPGGCAVTNSVRAFQQGTTVQTTRSTSVAVVPVLTGTFQGGVTKPPGPGHSPSGNSSAGQSPSGSSNYYGPPPGNWSGAPPVSKR